MGKYLRGNQERETKQTSKEAVSLFAARVLANVGGSCVYISPKKGSKLVDLDAVE